jgi:hypothetical protein
LSGSGRNLPTHAVTGHPVARRARATLARCTASTTRGTPAASETASTSSALSRSSTRGAVGGREVGRSLRDVLAQACPGGRLRPDPGGDRLLQLGDAVAGAGGRGQHRHSLEAVLRQQTSDVGQQPVAAVRGHLVHVVEHDQHHVAVARQRFEEAVVDGGVGVLLGVQDPHHQIGQPDESFDLEVVADLRRVVVGQVEEHEPLQVVASGPGVEHGVAGDLVTRRYSQPLQQVIGARRAPDARGGPGRGGSAHADGRQIEPGEPVEGGGLAGAGGAGQRDHGVLGGEPQPRRGALDDVGRLVDQLVVEAPAGGTDGVGEPRDAGVEVRTAARQSAGTLDQRAH